MNQEKLTLHLYTLLHRLGVKRTKRLVETLIKLLSNKRNIRLIEAFIKLVKKTDD